MTEQEQYKIEELGLGSIRMDVGDKLDEAIAEYRAELEEGSEFQDDDERHVRALVRARKRVIKWALAEHYVDELTKTIAGDLAER